MTRRADCALPNSLATQFLDVLNAVGCPYTEDIDEAYVGELIYTPGEHRIRFLMWVLGQVDESIDKVLSSKAFLSRHPSDIGIDKRVQVLTSVAASIGLCRPADMDLIRGEVAIGKQLEFWKNVFAILQFSKRQTSEPTCKESQRLLEELHVFDPNILMVSFSRNKDLLPPNLLKEMKMLLPKEKHSLRNLDKARAALEEFSKNLEDQQARLEKLEKEALYTTDDSRITMNSVCRKLDLTLSDLDQMITTFDQVFINNYHPYCGKEKEEFGDLGDLFEIVRKQLSYVVSTVANLHSIRKSNETISKCLESWPKILNKVCNSRPAFFSESVSRLDAISKTLETERQKHTVQNDCELQKSSQLTDMISGICTL